MHFGQHRRPERVRFKPRAIAAADRNLSAHAVLGGMQRVF
jgi:hypothetical protein